MKSKHARQSRRPGSPKPRILSTLLLGIASLLASGVSPGTSLACSCYDPRTTGFLAADCQRDVTVQRLPANARGVLFGTSEVAATLSAGDFEVLVANEPIRPIVSELAPVTENEQQALSKELQDRRLWRIGVEGGFRPGLHYEFRYHGVLGSDDCSKSIYKNVLHVSIDRQAISASSLKDVSVDLGEGPRIALVSVPSSPQCRSHVAAVAQPIALHLPAELEPYRESLMEITLRRSLAEDGRSLVLPWEARQSLCSVPQFGRSEIGPARDLLFARCDGGHGTPLRRGDKAVFFVLSAFLEVFDRFEATDTMKVTLKLPEGETCDAKAAFVAAMESGDRDRIKESLCAAESVLGRQNFQDQIVDMVFPMLRDTDTRIRICAAEALDGGSITFWKEHPSMREKVLAELIDLALTESDERAQSAQSYAVQRFASAGEDRAFHQSIQGSMASRIAEMIASDLLETRRRGAHVAMVGKLESPEIDFALADAAFRDDPEKERVTSLLALEHRTLTPQRLAEALSLRSRNGAIIAETIAYPLAKKFGGATLRALPFATSMQVVNREPLCAEIHSRLKGSKEAAEKASLRNLTASLCARARR